MGSVGQVINDNMSHEVIRIIKEKVFDTDAGKELLITIFEIGLD